MPTFLINHLRIPNVEATFLPYGGKWLAFGDHDALLEGAWPGSVVLMAFPDREAAMAWYHSPAYQEILHLRTHNAISDIILVDEVDPGFTSAGFARQLRGAMAAA